MIVRDGVGDRVDLAIASAREHVDEVCIWENGSTDGTTELLDWIAKQPGAPIVIEHGEWTDDFAAAREASFAMTTAEWIIHFDANDELRGGENLRKVVARADAAGADITWMAYNFRRRAEIEGGGASWYWWPRIVRRGTGRWLGQVHEHWMHPGIDRWRDGVGQPGSVYAHPGRLSLYHRDRELVSPLKYKALLEKAARDPARTPWALQCLGNERALAGDDERAVEFWQAYLDAGGDACEGPPHANGRRVETLHMLALACERLGLNDEAARYTQEWENWSVPLQQTLSDRPEVLAFYLQLGTDTVKWASMQAATVDLLLEAP